MAVTVVLLSVVLIGFVALSVDLGMLYNAKQELKRATIAAALAGATSLSQSGGAMEAAVAAAMLCAENNEVTKDGLTLLESDIVFGTWDAETEVFTPNEADVEAVHVVGRRVDGSSADGAVDLFFASIFGINSADITAEATAVMRPRDMAIVADLSNSHNNDSELRSLRNTQINLHAVWDGLFERGEWPGWSTTDEDAIRQSAGWGWGFFKRPGRGWGTKLDPDSTLYSPISDNGLVEMRYTALRTQREDWDPAASTDFAEMQLMLQAQGYSGDFETPGTEIWAILGDHLGSGPPGFRAMRFDNWANRVAIATGFAEWNSGIPGGRGEGNGEPQGSGNRVLGDDDDEMVWNNTIIGARTPDQMADIWREYTQDYMYRGNTTMVDGSEGGDPLFQFRIGIKTFLNFMLDRRPLASQTSEFAHSDAPQPMQAVREAVWALADTMTVEMNDLVSLEIYGTTARNEVPLTNDHDSVPRRLWDPATRDGMQAGHYDGYTNVGGGIRLGRLSLTGGNARPNATKVIILLTDGRPTAWDELEPPGPDGVPVEPDPDDPNTALPTQPGRLEIARQYAIQQAEWARNEGIRIFAVSVGVEPDDEFMQELARITNGRVFRAVGDIDTYSAALRLIFEQIATLRPVTLVQ